MNKILFFASILLLSSCGVQKLSQDKLITLLPVKLYETTNDYLSKNTRKEEAGVLIKKESHQHITIKGVYDMKTGEKIKRGISSWAIEYNGTNYFNLGYSSDLNNWFSFAKFDFEGRYCGVIIDKNSPTVLTSTSNNYGGGLTGVLIAESTKWNKNWKDKEGNKKKLLFIFTEQINPQSLDRNEGSVGNYLTRKDLKDIMEWLKMPLNDEKVKDIEFEEVIEIIKTANRR